MTENRVDQSGAQAREKIVGRDDNSVNILPGENPHIKALVRKLDEEIENENLKTELIESLQFFDEPFLPDEVRGLENKLRHSGRAKKIPIAIRQKELFAKFLSRYSLYGAAQELLALCLHRIHQEFEEKVHSQCGSLPQHEIDRLIITEVVNCVVDEYSLGTFALNHGVAHGMVFWLAERCFIRWHATE